MKSTITLFFVAFISLLSSMKIMAQEIEIDLTFTHDTIIYPFGSIDTISELNMSGDLILNQDTSLVRVILEDTSGIQYMVLEAYPLICSDTSFSFNHHCDETCFLDLVNPYSIIIQIIDASLDLSSLYYSSDVKENCIEERYKAKRAKDEEKIELMNQIIPAYGMNWVAEDNGMVEKYYEQKRHIFGNGYSLLGFEYYKNGVFEFIGHSEYPKVDPDLVRQFDWRDRHGANDPSSPYWDGDSLGTGWLTSVKDQGNYNTCWAFSAVGQLEAIANLYANDTLDFDQSEREVVFCVEGDCDGGNPVYAINYFSNQGVIPETCFPYELIDCANDECPQKCAPPNINLKIDDYDTVDESNYDSVRLALINYGPLSIGYTIEKLRSDGHSVVLCGYFFNTIDSSCTWIIKNSWGIDDEWGVNGFCNLKIDHLKAGTVGAVKTPVYANSTPLSVNCYDKDGDSLSFWGIGQRPENCPCYCDTIEDCDDNNPFVGGYDENFYCTCLLEMDTVSHHITADTTWSDTTYVNYEVIVDSGVCLTISSYAAFAPEAGIIVKQGGELNVNGGYLTKVCPDLWKGIEVWGSDTLQSFDKYFGQVNLSNNAIVEFAIVGISNYCSECDSNSMQSGGLIRADSSIFRNNITDVYFAPFKNMWQGNELPYFSGFEKCTFITTEEFYPEFIPEAHVELIDIRALAFYGCVFKNETYDSIYPFPIRGTGIYSIDANFMLLEACNTQIVPCNDFTSC